MVVLMDFDSILLYNFVLFYLVENDLQTVEIQFELLHQLPVFEIIQTEPNQRTDQPADPTNQTNWLKNNKWKFN